MKCICIPLSILLFGIDIAMTALKIEINHNATYHVAAIHRPYNGCERKNCITLMIHLTRTSANLSFLCASSDQNGKKQLVNMRKKKKK